MVATELLKLTLETDEERKARLKKMVATTQFRLTLYFVFENSKNKRNDFARPVIQKICKGVEIVGGKRREKPYS